MPFWDIYRGLPSIILLIEASNSLFFVQRVAFQKVALYFFRKNSSHATFIG
jgi:hypothetical protein